MSNYKQDPFINLEGIEKIQRELGRLFEGEWVKPSSRYDETGEWSPATDTIEADSHWHFLFDLPGVALSDIDVSVHRGQIIVKGSKTPESVGNVVRQERTTGAFERVVALPDDTDETTLNAIMKNGVLHLSVAKTAVAGGRSIPVKEAD